MSRENLSLRFLIRSDTNQAVQPHVVKTKVLISCAVTLQLICAFAFAYMYVESRFSNVMAPITLLSKSELMPVNLWDMETERKSI